LISTAEFRNGSSITLNNTVYTIVEFQHVKPGKGGAFVRTRLKNIRTGQVIEKTFTAGERVEPAYVERRAAQYLYRSGDGSAFMDLDTYDQFELPDSVLGDDREWLVEGMEVFMVCHNGTPIGMELPEHVEFRVTYTEQGVRGDTAQGGTKPVTLEPGVVIQAPLFIETGDVLRVDTRTRRYIERVKK